MKCPELKFREREDGNRYAVQCADCVLSSYGKNCLGQPLIGRCKHCGNQLSPIQVIGSGDIIEQVDCAFGLCKS